MKKRTLFFAALLALGILSTACSQRACPAYSDNSTETTQEVG